MKVSELIEILALSPPDLEVFIAGVAPVSIAQFSDDGKAAYINIECGKIALDDADEIYYTTALN
jgi:hypothetical protein